MAKEAAVKTPRATNEKIVVISAGWVVMGLIVPATNPGVTRIEDASVIRVWGTTNGIGEIALKGPTKSTVLDYAGVVEVKDHAVIMLIDCIY
jgi:hypothetical protein